MMLYSIKSFNVSKFQWQDIKKPRPFMFLEGSNTKDCHGCELNERRVSEGVHVIRNTKHVPTSIPNTRIYAKNALDS